MEESYNQVINHINTLIVKVTRSMCKYLDDPNKYESVNDRELFGSSFSDIMSMKSRDIEFIKLCAYRGRLLDVEEKLRFIVEKEKLN